MFDYQGMNEHFYYGYPGQIMHGNPVQPPRAGMINNYPYPSQVQGSNLQPYQQQNPYYPGQFQPLNPVYQAYTQQPLIPSMQKDSQFLFKNPLQPQEEMYSFPNPYPQVGAFVNPYPKQNLIQKQPGGMHSLINSFKSQDGSVDFNKMMNTAGQMMNAVTQVTSLVKGLGGMFKV